MSELINPKIKEMLDGLAPADRDAAYRYLWAQHVREDVCSHAQTLDTELTADEIDYITERYVYDGDYDCNLDYWTNIENLIEEVSERRDLSGESGSL